MNSELPNSPEDRLLDELLHEQSHGPDEAFLQQIEKAVDAGPALEVKRSNVTHFGRFAIAASALLVAGAAIWWRPFTKDSSPPVIARAEKRTMHMIQLAPPPPSALQDEPVMEELVFADAPVVETTDIEQDVASASSIGLNANRPLLPPLPSDEGSQTAKLEISAGNGGAGSGTGRGQGLGAAPADALVMRDEKQTRQPRQRVVPPPASTSALGGNKDKFSKARSVETDASDRGGFILPGQAVPETTTSDRYGSFIDQPWKSPDRDPLSTFSIDVDTASYSNVRRMIREGREIPKDAVRIEEFINAFQYHYEAPKGDGPFAVGADLAVCPWAPKHQLVRVAIKGREIETGKRPTSNLVFLIDVSGSMQSPDKLPLLKQSMETMVSQLDERDRVAIVVYAGSEGVALPSTRLDAEGRAKVLTALAKLDAGGSTNGGAGIKRAYELAMEQRIAGGVNRVILATDGDFNVGVTGQEALVELVKDRAKSGVYLTVAGFGSGNLNDAMMDAITRDGNGNYFYIDSEREGRKVFLQNLAGTLVTIAKDVKIQVEFNPAKVGSYRLIGYANRVLRNEDFSNDKVDAGDIGAGHTVTAFYELIPPGAEQGTEVLKYQATPAKPAATNDWLTVKLRHKHPEGDESSLIEFPLTREPVPMEKADSDFQFATAAALLGMKLRSMDEVREMSWEQVIALAKPGLAKDVTEERGEFIELVAKLAGHGSPKPAAAEIRR